MHSSEIKQPQGKEHVHLGEREFFCLIENGLLRSCVIYLLSSLQVSCLDLLTFAISIAFLNHLVLLTKESKVLMRFTPLLL